MAGDQIVLYTSNGVIKDAFWGVYFTLGFDQKLNQEEDIVSKVRKETLTEKVTNSLVTSLGVTAVASYAAGPLGAILALLVNTLANDRYKIRVEETLNDIFKMLDEVSDKINQISDAQYKLINETLVTIHQTVEEEKLSFLKNAVRHTIDLESISHYEASIVSRVIRDISAREAKFLINNEFEGNKYNKICLDLEESHSKSTSNKKEGGKVTSTFVITFKPPAYVEDGVLHVSGKSEQMGLVNGLITLGLLIPTKITSSSQYYSYSPIVENINNLLKN